MDLFSQLDAITINEGDQLEEAIRNTAERIYKWIQNGLESRRNILEDIKKLDDTPLFKKADIKIISESEVYDRGILKLASFFRDLGIKISLEQSIFMEDDLDKVFNNIWHKINGQSISQLQRADIKKDFLEVHLSPRLTNFNKSILKLNNFAAIEEGFRGLRLGYYSSSRYDRLFSCANRWLKFTGQPTNTSFSEYDQSRKLEIGSKNTLPDPFKSVKIFKNGRIDIEFSTREKLEEFATFFNIESAS